MALLRARVAGVFWGISIGNIEISLFFYADDVVILSPWSLDDATHIICILRCFFLASGLKINLYKSRLICVGIHSSQVVEVANVMGCVYEFLPFTHLGVPVGQNMNRVNSRAPIIDRFCNMHAKWKAKCLSFGGCLTLVKLVLGSLSSYFMSIFPALVTIIRELESLRVICF